MLKVLDNGLEPEETYEVLEAYLTDILQRSGAGVDDDVMGLLLSYDRTLKIALGIPVEVPD